MALKGQSSVEFMSVLGIALVISSPFIYASQSSVIELDDASRFLTLENSFNDLTQVTEGLSTDSPPARKTVEFQTPSGVEKVYNPVFGNESALVFEMDSKAGLVNRSIFSETVIDVKDTGELKSQGLHSLSVRKADEGINVSVIS